MITIRSALKYFQPDRTKLAGLVEIMLGVMNYPGFDLTVTLTNDVTTQYYNRKYGSKRCPHGVIYFPFHADLFQEGEKIVAQSPEEQRLGDLILSLENVERVAQEWGKGFEETLLELIAHGIIHLCNYDHRSDFQVKRVVMLSKRIMAALPAHDMTDIFVGRVQP